MRPPSPRRPGGARSHEEEPPRVEEAAASFDEIVSPSADAETQGPKRRSSSLTQRRRARTTVDRPMPVADAASLLGGEEATDLGDRLRERTRARRILLARRIALTLVTLALAAGGVWVAFFSPVFAFSSSAVVVSGEDGTLVTADSVRSSIASFEGVPLTRLNTQAVARAVESNVAVRSASVSRRWPTSLRVSVTMRTGMAVEAASGGYWLVDDQGVAFQQVPSAGEYPLATLPGGPGDRRGRYCLRAGCAGRGHARPGGVRDVDGNSGELHATRWPDCQVGNPWRCAAKGACVGHPAG